ncbi:MAG: hypothetical protein WBA76_08700 [Phormidesmis sp.]
MNFAAFWLWAIAPFRTYPSHILADSTLQQAPAPERESASPQSISLAAQSWKATGQSSNVAAKSIRVAAESTNPTAEAYKLQLNRPTLQQKLKSCN